MTFSLRLKQLFSNISRNILLFPQRYALGQPVQEYPLKWQDTILQAISQYGAWTICSIVIP
ncbi:MAG: hypothetical protein KME11_15735 [Timaviella obliquedivisa GSE-PSE-MK23-08B]|nr:hypothetical protein [Timaviella obliquedivisa GSE-PSE-MK23-08B]